LWQVSGLERVRKCRRVRHGESVGLRRTVREGVMTAAGVEGVTTCGSVWACPCCSSKILVGRRAEVAEILEAHVRAGGRVAFLTLTLRHERGDKLSDLWSAACESWSALRARKAWRRGKRDFGIVGALRAVEVTRGEHGWHPHIHVFVLLRDEPTDLALGAWAGELFAGWREQVARRGFSADWKAQDLRLLSLKSSMEALAAYVSKASWELAAGDKKRGRSAASRTPWGVLEDFAATGDMADLELWREFEAASRGRRQITGLGAARRALGLSQDDMEVTDEELAREDSGGELVALVSADGWRSLCLRPFMIGLILDDLPRGTEWVLSWLSLIGVEAWPGDEFALPLVTD
jgi:hypothetical protein